MEHISTFVILSEIQYRLAVLHAAHQQTAGNLVLINLINHLPIYLSQQCFHFLWFTISHTILPKIKRKGKRLSYFTFRIYSSNSSVLYLCSVFLWNLTYFCTEIPSPPCSRFTYKTIWKVLKWQRGLKRSCTEEPSLKEVSLARIFKNPKKEINLHFMISLSNPKIAI